MLNKNPKNIKKLNYKHKQSETSAFFSSTVPRCHQRVALPPQATRPDPGRFQKSTKSERIKKAMCLRMGSASAKRAASHFIVPSFKSIEAFSSTSFAERQHRRQSTFRTTRNFAAASSPLLPAPIPIDEVPIDPQSPGAQIAIVQALAPHYKSQTPVVLRSMLSKSDAYYCWRSLDYLQAAVGGDTPVYVEIGGSYADKNADKSEITFGEYIEYMRQFENKYGDGMGTENERKESEEQPPSHEIVYLAQNDLPSALYNDFDIPKLCDDASFARKYGVGGGNLYSCMFWMGPRGTLSPLHYDPLDNLLMQVVGTKRVLLYPKSVWLKDENNDISTAEEAAWAYAGSHGMQNNTSPVDVENPDLQKFPFFAKCPPPIECILKPGDSLYIPSKWWHHVRSLSRSVSVNAWWR